MTKTIQVSRLFDALLEEIDKKFTIYKEQRVRLELMPIELKARNRSNPSVFHERRTQISVKSTYGG